MSTMSPLAAPSMAACTAAALPLTTTTPACAAAARASQARKGRMRMASTRYCDRARPSQPVLLDLPVQRALPDAEHARRPAAVAADRLERGADVLALHLLGRAAHEAGPAGGRRRGDGLRRADRGGQVGRDQHLVAGG